MSQRTREAAWAGQFYPGQAKKLREMIDTYLRKAPATPVDGKILGLVVPHAGYIYSGQCAATGYNHLKREKIDTVVVLSPSHAEFLEGVSIYNGNAYATPLGAIPVNLELAQQLAQESPILRLSEQGHRTDGERADYAGAERGFIWKRVVELIKRRPLVGYGIENLGEVFNKYYGQDMIDLWGEVRYVDKAHNEYLHIAVTSGIPSLLSYLIFTIQIIKKGFTKLHNDSIMLLLLSSVLGYMTAAFFNISVVSVAYVYWIFLGMIASYYNK